MKTGVRIYAVGLLVCLIFVSCKTSYVISYQTYLENSKNESLQFKDSIISVKFIPLTNGIIFDIENLTRNNLFLIWDKSYFIEPSGTSAKLLNTDILETNSAIRNKENYESVLPLGGHFKRFTCAATNLSTFSVYTSNTIYNEASQTMFQNSNYTKFFNTGTYWYLGAKRSSSTQEDKTLDQLELDYVQKYIAGHNSLKLGFTIRNNGKEIEYHFKFPLKKVDIYKKTSDAVIYSLCYELSKDNGFNPVNKNNK